jgi:hypothetical protein
MKSWEIIADNLSKAGWSWGCVPAIDLEARTIWIVDAHRDDGKRFIVHADEKLTAFVELERQVLTMTFYLESIHGESRETRFVSLRAVTYTIRDAKSFGSQIVSQFSRRPQRSFKGHWVQMFVMSSIKSRLDDWPCIQATPV